MFSRRAKHANAAAAGLVACAACEARKQRNEAHQSERAMFHKRPDLRLKTSCQLCAEFDEGKIAHFTCYRNGKNTCILSPAFWKVAAANDATTFFSPLPPPNSKTSHFCAKMRLDRVPTATAAVATAVETTTTRSPLAFDRRLPTTPLIHNDRMFMPARSLAHCFGCDEANVLCATRATLVHSALESRASFFVAVDQLLAAVWRGSP